MKQAERIERIAKLTSIIELYEVKRKCGTLRGGEIERYKAHLAELAKLKRIERGWNDIMAYAQTYFRDVEPPYNLLDINVPSPAFHFELAKTIRDAIVAPGVEKVAIAAARSHSKTTIANNITLCWVVCYAEDLGQRYWLMLSDKQANAARFLDIVKEQLSGNPLLIADFGELKGSSVWNQLEVVTANGVKIQAAGQGEALRGLRFGPYRPNVLADDIESDESCSTIERVQKTLDWWDRTVEPLGDPKKMKTILIGTLISQNSLLGDIMANRSDWKVSVYAAVIEFPDRLDLWDQWDAILKDRSHGENPIESTRIAGQRAREFYEAHKAEMDSGAIVLWPERMDLYSLMLIRATRRLSFLSEYMQINHDETTQIFKTLRFYNPQQLDQDDLDYYYGLDSALGKSKRSDLTALITVAKSRRSGYIFVIDVDVRRCSPNETINVLFEKMKRYKYRDGCADSTGFQSFIIDEIRRRSAASGLYIPCREHKTHNQNKDDRVAAMEPMVSQFVFFHPSQTTLLEQLSLWPKAPKRDAADALSQVLELLRDNSTQIVWGKL